MDIKYAAIGFARGLGFAVLFCVLSYIGVAEHLSFLGPVWSGLISMFALAVEHAIEAKTGRALLGAVKA